MSKKIIVVQDFLLTKGGVERVALTLAEAFEAPILTAAFNPSTTFEEFQKLSIFCLNVKIKKSPFLQSEAALLFRRMNLENFDVIISSGNWAKQVSVRPNNHPHIHYEHTPPRALYDLKDEVKKRLPFPTKPFFEFWCRFMEKLDREATEKVDIFLTNSLNTKRRVIKFYGRRDTKVLYPPVDIEKIGKGVRKFKGKFLDAGYFLSVQRIEPEKRVEMQLEIFRKLPNERLIVVGVPGRNITPYFSRIKKMCPKNVEIRKNVSEDELMLLYANCKAVIQTAIDEDFGLVPVEAMAAGKPCLAVNEGGFKETILHGRTGLLVNPPYVKNFITIIRKFDDYHFSPKECMERAKLFSKERFVREFKKIVRNL